MANASVKWLEKRVFIGVDSSKHGIVISTPNHELGGIGVKPSDLLLLSLAACTAHSVVDILVKKRQPFTGLEVQVSAGQEPDPPWTFTGFHMRFTVFGSGLSEKAVTDAVTLAEEKYCSVSATIRRGAPVTVETEIVSEA